MYFKNGKIKVELALAKANNSGTSGKPSGGGRRIRKLGRPFRGGGNRKR